jgi:hypothetical protein
MNLVGRPTGGDDGKREVVTDGLIRRIFLLALRTAFPNGAQSVQSAKVHCNQSTPKLTSTTQPRMLRQNTLVALRLRCVPCQKLSSNEEIPEQVSFFCPACWSEIHPQNDIKAERVCDFSGWAVLRRFRDSIRATLNPTLCSSWRLVQYCSVAWTIANQGHQ